MRFEFFKELPNLFAIYPKLYVLTGDLGYIGWDRIRDEFPDRFINCGASEQAMLDIACGLALDGKKPLVYSITPFLLYRGFETLRTYVNHEKIPIKLIGSGRNNDYKHDGYSHNASDVRSILNKLGNIQQYYPIDTKIMISMLPTILTNDDPIFLSLCR